MKRVLSKADEDAIFFMAGAISFNVIVAMVPLLLLGVGISGMLLSAWVADPVAVVLEAIEQLLPVLEDDLDLTAQVQEQIANLLGEGVSFTLLGGGLLVWLSTRLVGTLRTVLREVFDISESRGLVGGKLFDILVVMIGGLFFLANVWFTTGLQVVNAFGRDILGLEGTALSVAESFSVQLLAFLSIWLLFLGIYRFLPARRIPGKAVVIAATFNAVLYEVLKSGFGWYVSDVANYRSTYGNLISLAVLFFWIYYGAIGFILGGEVAQVWTMRRARRVQLRRVHGGGE